MKNFLNFGSAAIQKPKVSFAAFTLVTEKRGGQKEFYADYKYNASRVIRFQATLEAQTSGSSGKCVPTL